MLINYKSLASDRELVKSGRHDIKAARFINELVDQEIGYVVGEIRQDETIHIANDSRWSLHDLLVHIVKQIGPSALHFCTYAIKEYQARIISNMLQDGILTEVNALVDYRFKKLDPQAEQLLSKICNTHRWEERLHGKVTVLRNKEWGVSIVGSANFTTNTSRDALIVTSSIPLADYWINWIQKNIKHENKP